MRKFTIRSSGNKKVILRHIDAVITNYSCLLQSPQLILVVYQLRYHIRSSSTLSIQHFFTFSRDLLPTWFPVEHLFHNSHIRHAQTHPVHFRHIPWIFIYMVVQCTTSKTKPWSVRNWRGDKMTQSEISRIQYRLSELLCLSAVPVPVCKSDNCLCWISSRRIRTACFISMSSHMSVTSSRPHVQQTHC